MLMPNRGVNTFFHISRKKVAGTTLRHAASGRSRRLNPFHYTQVCCSSSRAYVMPAAKSTT
ncbi:hypothetical protein, partial [Burkholderia ubonensis]|uniref:hypothetical protein n=1 Tax=Burkholderia ubonensis TaxID=101571 RepID=UPI001E4919D9